ncbi:hypothetical protein ACFQV4_29095 [Streptomyces thermocarboxydus]
MIHTRVTTAAWGRGTVEIRPRSAASSRCAPTPSMLELTLRGSDAEAPAVDVRRGQAALDGCETAAPHGRRCW